MIYSIAAWRENYTRTECTEKETQKMLVQQDRRICICGWKTEMKCPSQYRMSMFAVFHARIMTCIVILFFTVSFRVEQLQAQEPVRVFVSILPQKYFVEQIGGDRVAVQVMVGPGRSPENYEPTPAQMMALGGTKLFFRIGVIFERSWMDRLASLYPDLVIVDTRQDIPLREMESIDMIISGEERRGAEEDDHGHAHEQMDPHIWLSPDLVKIQAATMAEALSRTDPSGEVFYRENLARFSALMDSLSAGIRRTIDRIKLKRILVFHPAWGYFCDQFGLRQIPIEIEGKEPSPGELAKIISYVRENRIRVIFTQAQFSTRTAEVIAREIGGTVIAIDPLAENYCENLMHIAETMAENLQ